MASSWASFAPTPAELAYATQMFNTADPQKLGIITGEAAVPLLAGANLPPEKLGEIWAIADHDNNGFLTKKGVAVAVRLIGWAQKGEVINDSLLLKHGPLPTITGIVAPPSPGSSARIGSPVPRAISPPPRSALPPLTSTDRAKYLRLFVNSGPSGGLLAGDKARDIFLKSRLPLEKLGLIWNLADTHNRGSLDAADFAIGMHLIQASMTSPTFVIPGNIPPGFYEQASGGRPLTVVREHATGNSIPSPSVSAFSSTVASPIKPTYTGQPIIHQTTGTLRPQMTGQSHTATPSFATQSFSSPQQHPSIPQPSSDVWDVTLAEKTKFDTFFDSLDTQKRGFIEGDVAVPFMLESKLPELLLAQIWDLSDLNNDGKLTRDGFAVAMHLINGNLAGREVPNALPPSLIPPSSRPVAPRPSAPPVQSEVQTDLWLLDEDTPIAAALPTPPPSLVQTSSAVPPVPAVGASSATENEPGRRIQRTDFLSDDEDEPGANASLSASSAVIGNTKNQLDSTTRALNTTEIERKTLERAVADSAAQLAQLESQLASAKEAHQNETKLVGDLQDRQRGQADSIRTTREELIRAESDLSALRAEKADVEGSVLRDKEEIRDLQRKLKEVTEETVSSKVELEKVKKEARQQKGLLAIARKQLSNAETEREKVAQEIATENSDLEQARADLAVLVSAVPLAPPTVNEAPASLPANIPLPETPDQVASPALSTKSNNPFGRHLTQLSSPPSPTVYSPFTLPTSSEQGIEQAELSPPIESDPFEAAFGTEEKDPALSVAIEVPTSNGAAEVLASMPGPDMTVEDMSSPSPVELSGAHHKVPKSRDDEQRSSMNGVSPPVEDASAARPHEDLPPLKEIEHESDSSDDDDVPLGKSIMAKEGLGRNTEPMPISAADWQSHLDDTPVLVTGTTASAHIMSHFEDTFGLSNTTTVDSQATTAPPLAKDTSTTPPDIPSFGLGASTTNGKTLTDVSPQSRFPELENVIKPASNAELDAAFGGSIPTGAPIATDPNRHNTVAEQKPFTFESSFDDTFDFPSVSGDANPPTPELQRQPNDSSFEKASPPPTFTPTSFTPNVATPDSAQPTWPSVPARPNQSTAFDAASNLPTMPAPAPSTANMQTLPSSASYQPLSFDDAFGSPSTIPPLDSHGTLYTVAANAVLPDSTARSHDALARPASQFVDSNAPKRSTSPRPRSPVFRPRSSASPPPPSPKGKGSTDPPPQRTSKLSLHFPFGKNKSKNKAPAKKTGVDEPAPRSARTLSPSASAFAAPDAIGSPGPDEDVAAVTTLINMGFTRQKAVEALERHSYDVSAALNTLLPSQ